VIDKGSSWFKTDKSAGVVITTRAEGLTGSGQKHLEFPHMEEVKITEYRDGSVILPLNFGVVKGLKLKDGDHTVDSLAFDFTVVKKRGNTGFAKGLNAILALSREVPFPISPFGVDLKTLGGLATTVVSEVAKDDESTAMLRDGKITLNFSPAGDCSSQEFEQTGVIAVVRAGEGKHMVDISRLAEYTWRYKITPAFSLEYCSVQQTDKKCTEYTAIRNQHYGFLLIAVSDVPPKQIALTPNRLAIVMEDTQGVMPALSREKIPETLTKDLKLRNSAAIQRTLIELVEVDPDASRKGVVARIAGKGVAARIAADLAATLRLCAEIGLTPVECLPSQP
jgi:hypothetical protein